LGHSSFGLVSDFGFRISDLSREAKVIFRKDRMPKISPQAIVEKGAQLADDVTVGPFSYVGAQASLGAGCTIENNVTIVGRTVLGRNNHVFPMCVIGEGAGAAAGAACVLGDANAIREHVTICGGREEPTRVGGDNLIMVDCHLGAGAVVGDHCIFANCTHVGERGRVEDYVRTSAFTTVEPGAKVGAYTFIAGFAGIDRDAPPFAIVQGFPFRVRGVNTQNLKRCGFGEEDIAALKEAFHDLFNGEDERPDEEALRRIARDPCANPHVRKLLETLRAAGGERR
jgi:UDP-N-acetylglucosamine acyltransferase